MLKYVVAKVELGFCKNIAKIVSGFFFKYCKNNIWAFNKILPKNSIWAFNNIFGFCKILLGVGLGFNKYC